MDGWFSTVYELWSALRWPVPTTYWDITFAVCQLLFLADHSPYVYRRDWLDPSLFWRPSITRRKALLKSINYRISLILSIASHCVSPENRLSESIFVYGSLSLYCGIGRLHGFQFAWAASLSLSRRSPKPAVGSGEQIIRIDLRQNWDVVYYELIQTLTELSDELDGI